MASFNVDDGSDRAEPLTAEARARVAGLFAQAEASRLRAKAAKRELAARPDCADARELRTLARQAHAVWEEAMFTLVLGLGTPINEAAAIVSIEERVRERFGLPVVLDAPTSESVERGLADLEAYLAAHPGDHPISGKSSDLTAKEAAAELGLLRPDGTPRDSFYGLVKDLGGYPVAGKWRFRREDVDAFKRKGRNR